MSLGAQITTRTRVFEGSCLRVSGWQCDIAQVQTTSTALLTAVSYVTVTCVLL